MYKRQTIHPALENWFDIKFLNNKAVDIIDNCTGVTACFLGKYGYVWEGCLEYLFQLSEDTELPLYLSWYFHSGGPKNLSKKDLLEAAYPLVTFEPGLDDSIQIDEKNYNSAARKLYEIAMKKYCID